MGYESSLRDALDLSVVKKESSRASSLAFSKTGNIFTGALVESDTNALCVGSEHVALLQAIQQQDYQIERVVSMQYNLEEGVLLSPITLKILMDFTRRTGHSISYALMDYNGSQLFECEDVAELSPYYQPSPTVLTKTINADVSPNWVQHSGEVTVDELKGLALNGISRSFTTYDSASGYGAAAVAGDRIYFSGQFSSFEGRLNIHAEMGAVITALMSGNPTISELGVVSTKHTEKPCNMCGICAQFIGEVSERYDLDIQIRNFASASDASELHTIDEYLPHSWSPRV